MTDIAMDTSPTPTDQNQNQAARASEAVKRGLKKRYAAERRFKAYGIAAVLIALGFIATLFGTIISNGLPAFSETVIKLEIEVSEDIVDPAGERDPAVLASANYRKLIFDEFRGLFPDLKGRSDRRAVTRILSSGATFELQRLVTEDPGLVGQTITFEVPVAADFDLYHKGVISRDVGEDSRRLKDKQLDWFDSLVDKKMIDSRFNITFFTHADSRDPELSGILGAITGSFFYDAGHADVVVPDRRRCCGIS